MPTHTARTRKGIRIIPAGSGDYPAPRHALDQLLVTGCGPDADQIFRLIATEFGWRQISAENQTELQQFISPDPSLARYPNMNNRRA